MCQYVPPASMQITHMVHAYAVSMQWLTMCPLPRTQTACTPGARGPPVHWCVSLPGPPLACCATRLHPSMAQQLPDSANLWLMRLAGNLALGLGKLTYLPPCVREPSGYASLLDELGAQLCQALHRAKPQVKSCQSCDTLLLQHLGSYI